ncbi:MAG: alkyl sulfatase dimerization domain-containing protein [Myxococcota bacterium]
MQALVPRVVALALLASFAACKESAPPPPSGGSEAGSEAADANGFSAPTSYTRAAQAAVARALKLDDPQDFEDAKRGLVASDPNLVVAGPDGKPIWDAKTFAFVQGAAPASVNPSLWRQAQLNGIHGLFQVAEGIYQVRGYDLANLSLIRGATGWIVVDPLTSKETAAAALALARSKLGDPPITAVIFTHSHVDHFSGIEAVLPADAEARKSVRIIAPAGFMSEATSENVLGGTTMGRRAMYMYGMSLPRSERGFVDTGLGKLPARGTIDIATPTELVDHTPQPLTIDGVDFVFQYAPHSEAPAELTFYLPAHKAWCAAEIATHNLHNLYTLRGAKVRDALLWAGYLDEALAIFPETEVVFASHHWPVWGADRVSAFVRGQRDTYRFIHDQTLRLASDGATPREIAEQVALPESVASSFANRDYYGTVKHNAKAVYQMYFGWYDGNPANLDPLPPVELGAKYVEAIGGAAAVKQKANEAFARGEYRWVATLLDHLVFAAPSDAEAKELLARAYDQLGYVAESGPWRSVYLTGAWELRHGAPTQAAGVANAMGLLRAVPLEYFFTAMATRVNGTDAAGKPMTLNFTFTDVGETHVLALENGVLQHRKADADPKADVTVKLTRDFFLRLTTGQAGLRDLIFSDDLNVEGSRMQLLSFFSLLERPDGLFPIVTP